MASKDKKATKGNGSGKGVSDGMEAPDQAPQIDPEIMGKITQLRSTIRENFGKVVMTLMMVPRYRAQTLSDLNHLDSCYGLRTRRVCHQTPRSQDCPAIHLWLDCILRLRPQPDSLHQ